MDISYKENTQEVIVKNEFDHSYLLFPMKEYEKEEYSFQMISQNNIPGLINCNVRYIEDNPYYCYEISSKKSLLQEYIDKKIRYKDLKELFYNINKCIKKAAEFLLEKDGFLLEPEYIFMDLEGDGFFCVYLPVVFYAENGEGRYRKLADFLLDRTDHKDEHAVNAVYQFYKMSKEEFFSFEAFIGFMEKEELMLQAEERRKEEKRSSLEEKETAYSEEYSDTEELREGNKQERRVFQWKLPCVLSIVGILLTGLYLFIPSLKVFALYLLIPGLTMMAVSVILWGFALYRRFWGDRQEEFMGLDTQVTVEEYFDDILDDETVFFDEEVTLCLKWKEGRFSKEYLMTTFPVTVGKLKESVQLYIEDASISRLHARFTQQDDVVILQDLDSTNGTRINGKKLAAGEEVVIRRNDEIQFGKIIVNVV